MFGQFFLVIREFSVENRHEIRVSEIFSKTLLLFLQSLNINTSILCCCDILPIAKDREALDDNFLVGQVLLLSSLFHFRGILYSVVVLVAREYTEFLQFTTQSKLRLSVSSLLQTTGVEARHHNFVFKTKVYIFDAYL